MGTILRIGTRPSRLALRQVEEIRAIFPRVNFKVRVYQTPGDRDRVTPISDIEDTHFFTRDLDDALIRDKIDLALHSGKDLPLVMTDGLKVIFETRSISPYDCLISRSGAGFSRLPPGSKIGASSRRRKEQVRRLRPDLLIVDVRGNVDQRIRSVENGRIDALIAAHAALIRLGMGAKIAEVLSEYDFPTHPKQGSLSVVVRQDRWQELKSILSEQARVTGS